MNERLGDTPETDAELYQVIKARKARKPVVHIGPLDGPDGNAWVIMGLTCDALLAAGLDSRAYTAEAMSGDYDHLLEVTRKWVTLKIGRS